MTQAEFLDREEVREARQRVRRRPAGRDDRRVREPFPDHRRHRCRIRPFAAWRRPLRGARRRRRRDEGQGGPLPGRAGDRHGRRRARQAGAGAGDRVRGGRPLVGARGQKPRAGRIRGRAVDPARRDRRADGDRAHGAVARARRALALPDARGRRHAGAARDRRRDRGRQPACAGEPRRRHPTRRRSSAGTPRPGATRQPP